MTDMIAFLRSATNADPHKYEVSISIREAKQILAKLEDQQAEIERLRHQVKVDEMCLGLRTPFSYVWQKEKHDDAG
jgi:hypothetical protein